MVYIQEEALTLKNELGQGEFGSVLKGTYRTPEGNLVGAMNLSAIKYCNLRGKVLVMIYNLFHFVNREMLLLKR